jgi:uncharacterized protein YcbX
MPALSAIHIYPVKSCAGIRVPRARIEPRGLEHDRAFMIVRLLGKAEQTEHAARTPRTPPGQASAAQAIFVTQREHPVLATVSTRITPGGTLVLRAGDADLEVPLDPAEATRGRERLRVRVWSDDVEAAVLGDDATAFFSGLLGTDVRLVAMPPEVRRPVDPTYARSGDHVSFADGFPVLLATEASLAELGARIEAGGGARVPMSRFRANLVVTGGEPFDEERHARVRIGQVVFRMPKRCARCQVTTVDQDTGEVPSKEPLRTLALTRRDGANVFFGQNLVPEELAEQQAGRPHVELACGDDVTYLD